jgi:hypothetical protein
MKRLVVLKRPMALKLAGHPIPWSIRKLSPW